MSKYAHMTGTTVYGEAGGLPGGAGEYYFGPREFLEVAVDSLIDLSQTRGVANAQYGQIKASIQDEGLDNPINIARLDDAELEAYIAFTNRTWGSAATLEDFIELRQPDGRYNLIVAGHTRAAAVRELVAERAVAIGQPIEATILTKPLAETSVQAILSKQLSENLHSPVRQERTAMAVVELYCYGVDTGQWATADDFRKLQHGRVNKQMVEDALHFAGLSPEIRSLVFNGYIPYKAGVELGKAAPTVYADFAHEAQLAAGEDDEDIRGAAEVYLRGAAAYIANRKLNSTASARYIRAFVDRMTRETADEAAHEEPLFGLRSAAAIAREIRDREKRRFEKLLRELSGGLASTFAETATGLDAGRASDVAAAVLEDVRRANGTLAAYAGRLASGSAVEEVAEVAAEDVLV
ncbi:MAG TPA: hypothetical protein VLH84_04835 [Patescibacteria group bacterium]|nr:hypothetical protein [Patescibacteria group bacterium]